MVYLAFVADEIQFGWGAHDALSAHGDLFEAMAACDRLYQTGDDPRPRMHQWAHVAVVTDGQIKIVAQRWDGRDPWMPVMK